jgi:hypothetical protein
MFDIEKTKLRPEGSNANDNFDAVADATPALINTDWIAYAFEQEPSRITLLKLGSPHMETLHVKEPLAEIREIIKRGAS